MKHFLKGAAAVAIVMTGLILIHIFCNMKGLDLDPNNIGEILLASSFATLIYEALLRKEKNKDDKEL